MKTLFTFIAVMFTGAALLLGGAETAEAKRLGGGESFGGKFSHSQPLKKDAPMQNSAAQRPVAKPAQQHNADRKQQLAQKGGLMGMLGALALGGLLGALFFGGAFEGVNFMDILLFALIAFLLFKFMARRSQPQAAAAGSYGHAPMDERDDAMQQRQSAAEYGTSQDSAGHASLAGLRSAAPKGFDQAAFLDGAKSCFARLQQAWDEGDLADIRQFTTDHVFGEIQDQYHARENDNRTEILSLDAELLSANSVGQKQEAIVLFRAELKEDGQQHQVEEVWHFIKPNQGQATWYLDGIQQVEG